MNMYICMNQLLCNGVNTTSFIEKRERSMIISIKPEASQSSPMDRRVMSYEMEQLRNENLRLKEILQNKENEIVQITYEMQKLRKDTFQLEETIQQQANKHAQRAYELERLNLELRRKIEHIENENAQLQHHLHVQMKIKQIVTNKLKQKNCELVEEKKRLFNKIEQLKCKECDKNCVIDTMLWICQNKAVGVDVELCRRQLEKIIIAYAGDKIKKDDLKCEQLMEILRKCEIVTIAAEYKYPSKMDAKVRVIDEAWNRLMRTDGNERVLILGRVISTANDQGHAEVCDLDTRRDGKVIIQNPQNNYCGHGNQQDFKNYVMKDEGLILYSVNIEKLRQIIKEHEDILHNTNKFEQTLTIPPGAIDEFQ